MKRQTEKLLHKVRQQRGVESKRINNEMLFKSAMICLKLSLQAIHWLAKWQASIVVIHLAFRISDQQQANSIIYYNIIHE